MPWFVLLYICISLLSTLFYRFVLFCLAFCSCALSISRIVRESNSFLGFFPRKVRDCSNAQTFVGKERIVCAKLIE
nr:MAG TPA: hypothetical protein [Caudoviricetes sp.]